MAGAESRKPMNIVFILMDDLGWRDVGCNGSTFHETPHIDQLAADGMRFTNAYASCPVCSPTRASIMTGRYPARIGLTDYLVGDRRGKMLPAEYHHELPAQEVTLANLLHEQGYVSASIGKWHLGPEACYPEKRGFDVNVAGCHLGHPPSYFWPYGEKEYRVPLAGGQEGEFLTERLTDEAVKFMRSAGDKPFFLYLSHYAVHNPQQARADVIERYERKRARNPVDDSRRFMEWRGRKVRCVQDSPIYAAMCDAMDQSVGRVVAELDALGIADNTVVVFTSDNGGLSTSEGTPTCNLPLAGGKGWLFEGGTRVPMVVRWPGLTRGGAVCGERVISMDWMPTLLRAAGARLRPDLHRDGVDLTPLFSSRRTISRRNLYWHYPHYSNQGTGPCGSMIEANWKLIEFFEDDHAELYNLERDPGETTPIEAGEARRIAKMRGDLREWRQSVKARMPRVDTGA